MHITIIGGGNLGHVMSAVLAHKNFNVILLTGDENKWNNSIEINYCDKYSFISNIRATSDFEESISNARHILLCLPGNAIRSNLYKIKEYIRDDAVIGSVVSSSGFFWMTRHILGSKNELYGFQRVPFISRITKYGDSAKITSTRSIHKIGVSSNFKSSNILSDYENALNAKVELLPNYLQAALTNSNPILHPSRMFTLFKDWSKSELYDHIPYFYEDWTCEDSENLISADNEFQNILSKLQVDMDQVPPLLNYYGVTDTKELTEKIKSIEAFKNIGTPMIKNNKHIFDFANLKY